MAPHHHPIAGVELAAPAAFHLAVHPHLALLHPELRFTAGGHHPLPFEKLIQAHEPGGVVERWDGAPEQR